MWGHLSNISQNLSDITRDIVAPVDEEDEGYEGDRRKEYSPHYDDNFHEHQHQHQHQHQYQPSDVYPSNDDEEEEGSQPHPQHQHQDHNDNNTSYLSQYPHTTLPPSHSPSHSSSLSSSPLENFGSEPEQMTQPNDNDHYHYTNDPRHNNNNNNNNNNRLSSSTPSSSSSPSPSPSVHPYTNNLDPSERQHLDTEIQRWRQAAEEAEERNQTIAEQWRRLYTEQQDKIEQLQERLSETSPKEREGEGEGGSVNIQDTSASSSSPSPSSSSASTIHRLQDALRTAESRAERATEGLNNLQSVLDQVQEERREEVRALTAERDAMEGQMEELRDRAWEGEQAIRRAEDLEEMVRRLEGEVMRGRRMVTDLGEQVESMGRAVGRTGRWTEDADLVERRVMVRLMLAVLEGLGTGREAREVVDVVSRVLGLSQEEQGTAKELAERIRDPGRGGGVLSGWLGGGEGTKGGSLSDLWAEFLISGGGEGEGEKEEDRTVSMERN